MKEYPEPNYALSVSMIGEPDEPRLGELLPRAYLIGVNRVVRIAVVPWLPESPWPPRYPTSWDDWSDRDEAASFLFATNAISIAPTDGPARDQTVIFPEYPEMEHTVFWLPRAEHEALLVDVERAYETSWPSRLRLLELSDGPLVELLRRDLPRAALSAYDREILCLDSVEGDQ
jgi:hypothetical protein